MAYDASPATTHNPATGSDAPAAWGDIVNENFAVLGGAWTAFTPAMTFSGGGSLTIGNGSIVGAYRLTGKTLKFRVTLTVGSTTSFGTGSWRFTLPGSSTNVAAEQTCGPARVFDGSTTYYASVVTAPSGATYVEVVSQTAASNGAHVTSAYPMTWGTSDVLSFSAEMEVA